MSRLNGMPLTSATVDEHIHRVHVVKSASCKILGTHIICRQLNRGGQKQFMHVHVTIEG